MTEVVIEHEWNSNETESVMKVVGGIVEMQKNRSLPQGFVLKSISLLKSKNRAICSWEAPSVSALKELLAKVNPPTSYCVSEASKIL